MKRKTRKQRKKQEQFLKRIGMACVLVLCVAVGGYMAMQSMGQQVADEYGCYDVGYQKQVAVIVDVSGPRWDEVQGRALRTYFGQLYEGLGFNEKLAVFTTEGNKISSVVKPSFSVCGQARSSSELADVGGAEASAGYLKRQKERLFAEVLEPELVGLLSLEPDESRLQLFESPVMEMILAVVRSARLEAGDRLVVMSDMVQNTESARFCKKLNDMPRFENFKKRRIYQERLKPRSLAGVEVETLMLLRPSYGQFCASEEELRGFWREYFKDNGVSEPSFIRIRSHGGFSGK